MFFYVKQDIIALITILKTGIKLQIT